MKGATKHQPEPKGKKEPEPVSFFLAALVLQKKEEPYASHWFAADPLRKSVPHRTKSACRAGCFFPFRVKKIAPDRHPRSQKRRRTQPARKQPLKKKRLAPVDEVSCASGGVVTTRSGEQAGLTQLLRSAA